MRKIIPIDRFFKEMSLSDEEKKRREDLARELEALFFLLFTEIEAEKLIKKDVSEIDTEYYKDMAFRRYREDTEVYIVLVAALLGRKTIKEELLENIKSRVSDIVDTTLKFDDEYYTSKDRATLLGCNEANYVGNDTQNDIAINQGYTRKQWETMRDEKVRFTHSEVDGVVIGINEYFKVGQAEMLYPMDMSRNAPPEEVVGCRCQLSYLR